MSQFTMHTLQLCLVLNIAELEMERGICWHCGAAGLPLENGPFSSVQGV